MYFEKYLKNNRGEAARIARVFSITSASVWEWAKNQVPAERVLTIWRETEGEVSPHEMRPDIYPEGVIYIKKRAKRVRREHKKAAPKGGACSKHIRADDFDTNDSPEILIPLSREE